MGSAQSGATEPEPLRSRIVSAARAHPALTFGILILLTAGAYAFVTGALPSEKRQVKQVLGSVLDALRRGDAEAVLQHVSPYFSEGGLTKRDLAKDFPDILRHRPISRAALTLRQLEVSATKAAARIHVTTYHHGAYGPAQARSEWTISFELVEGRWLVRGATPLSVNRGRVAGLSGVLDMAP